MVWNASWSSRSSKVTEALPGELVRRGHTGDTAADHDHVHIADDTVTLVPIPDDPFWRDFIAEMPARTAKFASVAKDGSPRVSPVWVALDGSDVMFTTHETSAKAKAIRRDPRLAMCFDDERPPFSQVILFGAATVSDDLDALRRWAAVLGGRYMGDDRADEYGRRNGVPGELLVRFTPTNVIVAATRLNAD